MKIIKFRQKKILKNKRSFLLHRCCECDIHFWKSFIKNKNLENILLLNNDHEYLDKFKFSVNIINILHLKKNYKVIFLTVCQSIKRISLLYFVLFESSNYWNKIRKGKVKILNKYIYLSIHDELNKELSLKGQSSLKLKVFCNKFTLFFRASNNIALAKYLDGLYKDLYIGYGHKVYTDYLFDLYFHLKRKENTYFFSLGHYSENVNDVFFSSKKLCTLQKLDINQRIHINKKNVDISGNINVIYLPVLGDSPNHAINWKRIFADYYSWLDYTIKFIGKSKEIWVIRIHPQAKFFNEDTNKILIRRYGQFLNNKNNLFIHNPDDNFLFDYDFSNVHRVLTFSGTIADESVCNRIKPILINTGLTNTFKYNLSWVPESIAKYKFLISDNLDKNNFKLDDKDAKLFEKYLRKTPRSFNDKLRWKTIHNGRVVYENKKLFKKEEMQYLINNINFELDY